jgi:MTH538 TIR-like domain (DUF1863)
VGRKLLEDSRQSAAEAAGADFAFDAFISYRRSDGTKAARRLRQRLQHYDIAKRLKSMKRKKLKVFLDTVYERGADDFYERNIRPALMSSRRLIVLATPDAVLRPGSDDWIQREIADFRAQRGSQNILVVRAAGDFLAELPGDLNATAPNIQIIDLRHDGFWSAMSPLRSSRLADEWIKLAAPMFDVAAADMPKLRREQERAQQRTLSVMLGGLSGAVAFAAALSWYALTQQRAAQQTLDNSLFAASRVIETASNLSLPEKDADQQQAMLRTACDLFDNLADEAAQTKFELQVLNCDVHRISALIDTNELERARTFLADVEPRVRARYGELKTAAWASAVANMLDLSIRIGMGSAKDNAARRQVIVENTRDFEALFEAHPTLFLAEGYSKRVPLLVDDLEKAGDFKGSAEVTHTAGKLFEAMARQEVDLQKETDTAGLARREFGFREAVPLFRRLGWMRAEKLEDPAGGIEAASSAIALAQEGQALAKKGEEQYMFLRWEEMLGEGVRGTALLRSERLAEGMEADKRALAIADDLMALGLNEAQQQDLEKEKTVLAQRVAAVAAALASP